MPSHHLPHEPPDVDDETLVDRARHGELGAVDTLVRRHQGFVYNVALRMLQDPADAEDATQEALLKIVTHLGSFRGESSFRTWAYRIAFRHVLDFGRVRAADGRLGPPSLSKPEQSVHGFDCFRAYIEGPDGELPDLTTLAPDVQVLVAEAKASCLFGMLLCLDREQRMTFVLGEIFELPDGLCAEVLGISRDAHRQKLARTRRQLYAFMQDLCGLVDPKNPCRCEKKTRAFVRDGIVDPRRLVFHPRRLSEVRAQTAAHVPIFERALETTYAELFRQQPMLEGPDLVPELRRVLGGGELAQLLTITSPGAQSHDVPS